MKNLKSVTTVRLTDENLEGYMRIATTEIKHDTVRLIKELQCHIPHM